MYGADWCPGCIQTKKFLKSKGIDFEYIDINNNYEAISFLERENNGKKIIPTLIINGKIYANPGINGLMKIITQ
jgi:thioredoxin reductase (NADPH)